MRTRKQLTDFVLLALFVGLIFLLGLTPLGLIPLGVINVTLLCIPVAVGTIHMGWKRGLLLGLAFGATSFTSAMLRPSALVSTLMGANMVYMTVMTFLPRLCVPLVIWGVYRLLDKLQKRLSEARSILNALPYMTLCLGLALLVYIIWGADSVYVLLAIAVILICGGVFALLQKKRRHVAVAVAAACGSLTNTVLYLGLMLLFYILCGIDNATVLTTIAAVAGGAGPAEAIAAAVICPPIVAAISKIRR